MKYAQRLFRPLRLAVAGLLLALAAPAAAQSGNAQGEWLRYPDARSVQIRDMAAIVHVTPEARVDVAVSIVNLGPLPAPEFRISRERLIIDGQLRRQIRSCRALEGGGFEAEIARRGRLSRERLTIVHMRVPLDADVAVGGANQVRVGRSDALDFSIAGCGAADIENVAGEAHVSLAGGAPDVRLYDAGSATVSLAGGGDITIGVVRRELTLSIAGAGEAVVARADGPTTIAVQGSGDVVIRDGRATPLSVAIAGAGDVVHNGSADRLDVAILGAGDVRVARVDGEVTRRILGAGDVRIGN
ncbi:MAG: DUF2807 domain-containing protein [Hyphomonadaceae bacterium]